MATPPINPWDQYEDATIGPSIDSAPTPQTLQPTPTPPVETGDPWAQYEESALPEEPQSPIPQQPKPVPVQPTPQTPTPVRTPAAPPRPPEQELLDKLPPPDKFEKDPIVDVGVDQWSRLSRWAAKGLKIALNDAEKLMIPAKPTGPLSTFRTAAQQKTIHGSVTNSNHEYGMAVDMNLRPLSEKQIEELDKLMEQVGFARPFPDGAEAHHYAWQPGIPEWSSERVWKDDDPRMKKWMKTVGYEQPGGKRRMLQDIAAQYGFGPKGTSILTRMFLQESGLEGKNSDGSLKTSWAGAMGIGQMMPGTLAPYLKERGLDKEAGLKAYAEDEGLQADIAVEHFSKLYQNYGGDVFKTLAAYNGGPGAVDYARKHGQYPYSESRDSWYQQTLDYVSAITGVSREKAMQGIASPEPLPEAKLDVNPVEDVAMTRQRLQEETVGWWDRFLAGPTRPRKWTEPGVAGFITAGRNNLAQIEKRDPETGEVLSDKDILMRDIEEGTKSFLRGLTSGLAQIEDAASQANYANVGLTNPVDKQIIKWTKDALEHHWPDSFLAQNAFSGINDYVPWGEIAELTKPSTWHDDVYGELNQMRGGKDFMQWAGTLVPGGKPADLTKQSMTANLGSLGMELPSLAGATVATILLGPEDLYTKVTTGAAGEVLSQKTVTGLMGSVSRESTLSKLMYSPRGIYDWLLRSPNVSTKLGALAGGIKQGIARPLRGMSEELIDQIAVYTSLGTLMGMGEAGGESLARGNGPQRVATDALAGGMLGFFAGLGLPLLLNRARVPQLVENIGKGMDFGFNAAGKAGFLPDTGPTYWRTYATNSIADWLARVDKDGFFTSRLLRPGGWIDQGQRLALKHQHQVGLERTVRTLRDQSEKYSSGADAFQQMVGDRVNRVKANLAKIDNTEKFFRENYPVFFDEVEKAKLYAAEEKFQRVSRPNRGWEKAKAAGPQAMVEWTNKNYTLLDGPVAPGPEGVTAVDQALQKRLSKAEKEMNSVFEDAGVGSLGAWQEFKKLDENYTKLQQQRAFLATDPVVADEANFLKTADLMRNMSEQLGRRADFLESNYWDLTPGADLSPVGAISEGLAGLTRSDPPIPLMDPAGKADPLGELVSRPFTVDDEMRAQQAALVDASLQTWNNGIDKVVQSLGWFGAVDDQLGLETARLTRSALWAQEIDVNTQLVNAVRSAQETITLANAQLKSEMAKKEPDEALLRYWGQQREEAYRDLAYVETYSPQVLGPAPEVGSVSPEEFQGLLNPENLQQRGAGRSSDESTLGAETPIEGRLRNWEPPQEPYSTQPESPIEGPAGSRVVKKNLFADLTKKATKEEPVLWGPSGKGADSNWDPYGGIIEGPRTPLTDADVNPLLESTVKIYQMPFEKRVDNIVSEMAGVTEAWLDALFPSRVAQRQIGGNPDFTSFELLDTGGIQANQKYHGPNADLPSWAPTELMETIRGRMTSKEEVYQRMSEEKAFVRGQDNRNRVTQAVSAKSARENASNFRDTLTKITAEVREFKSLDHPASINEMLKRTEDSGRVFTSQIQQASIISSRVADMWKGSLEVLKDGLTPAQHRTYFQTKGAEKGHLNPELAKQLVNAVEVMHSDPSVIQKFLKDHPVLRTPLQTYFGFVRYLEQLKVLSPELKSYFRDSVVFHIHPKLNAIRERANVPQSKMANYLRSEGRRTLPTLQEGEGLANAAEHRVWRSKVWEGRANSPVSPAKRVDTFIGMGSDEQMKILGYDVEKFYSHGDDLSKAPAHIQKAYTAALDDVNKTLVHIGLKDPVYDLGTILQKQIHDVLKVDASRGFLRSLTQLHIPGTMHEGLGRPYTALEIVPRGSNPPNVPSLRGRRGVNGEVPSSPMKPLSDLVPGFDKGDHLTIGGEKVPLDRLFIHPDIGDHYTKYFHYAGDNPAQAGGELVRLLQLSGSPFPHSFNLLSSHWFQLAGKAAGTIMESIGKWKAGESEVARAQLKEGLVDMFNLPRDAIGMGVAGQKVFRGETPYNPAVLLNDAVSHGLNMKVWNAAMRTAMEESLDIAKMEDPSLLPDEKTWVERATAKFDTTEQFADFLYPQSQRGGFVEPYGPKTTPEQRANNPSAKAEMDLAKAEWLRNQEGVFGPLLRMKDGNVSQSTKDFLEGVTKAGVNADYWMNSYTTYDPMKAAMLVGYQYWTAVHWKGMGQKLVEGGMKPSAALTMVKQEAAQYMNTIMGAIPHYKKMMPLNFDVDEAMYGQKKFGLLGSVFNAKTPGWTRAGVDMMLNTASGQRLWNVAHPEYAAWLREQWRRSLMVGGIGSLVAQQFLQFVMNGGGMLGAALASGGNPVEFVKEVKDTVSDDPDQFQYIQVGPNVRAQFPFYSMWRDSIKSATKGMSGQLTYDDVGKLFTSKINGLGLGIAELLVNRNLNSVGDRKIVRQGTMVDQGKDILGHLITRAGGTTIEEVMGYENYPTPFARKRDFGERIFAAAGLQVSQYEPVLTAKAKMDAGLEDYRSRFHDKSFVYLRQLGRTKMKDQEAFDAFMRLAVRGVPLSASDKKKYENIYPEGVYKPSQEEIYNMLTREVDSYGYSMGKLSDQQKATLMNMLDEYQRRQERFENNKRTRR